MSGRPPSHDPDPAPGDGPSPIAVTLYYDFASSIAYVAHRVMERMGPDLDALGLELRWQAIDLARLAGWSRGGTIDAVRRQNALRVARELGVELRLPGVWLDSRRVNAAAHLIEDPSRQAAWRERVWSAIFEQGRDVGHPDEWSELAGGLPELAVSKAPLAGRAGPTGGDEPSQAGDGAPLHSGLAALEAATRHAVERGVNGVPTFMLGRWPFGGIQEEDTMRSILGRYVRKLRAAAGASARAGALH
ncbi:MAG: DsbA family protein [Myxococcota bacterium]